MIRQHDYFTIKKARYFTLGEKSDKTRNIWLVCHGYGQLAENFIRKFECITDENNYIIAPEGLHRYYLDERHSRVGASWMTKEERLSDIEDYVRFLDGVMENEAKNFTGKVILLGFSQGVATAARWYRFGTLKPDIFILWAGVFPPDLPMEKELDKFGDSRNFVVIGNEDEFFGEERKKLVLDEIIQKGIKFDLLTFNGKHVIDAATLLELKNRT